MKPTMLKNTMIISAALSFVACASGSGDDVECPECDNVTELLVGTRCVPIEEVEPCGPDGHAHGTECHCFSGQDPTNIGGTEYCLQADCVDDPVEDPFEHACEHLGDAPESVTAVTSFADSGDAHADLDALVEVSLPSNQISYLHFPGRASGHVLVFLDTAGVFGGALDANELALPTESLGANPDCTTELPEIWEVEVINDSGMVEPQIIELNAGTVSRVQLVIVEEAGEH